MAAWRIRGTIGIISGCAILSLMRILTTDLKGTLSTSEVRFKLKDNVTGRPTAEKQGKPSFLLVIPGHGKEERTEQMLESIIHIAKTIRGFDFSCSIYAYSNVSIKLPHQYNCSTVRRKGGHWTHFMKEVKSSHDYVAILIDDVNVLQVDINRFLKTMQQFKIDVAAPALAHKWQHNVMERSAKHCKARITRYCDMLFTVFTKRAWDCWQQQIGVDRNAMGWGMDATFHFTCKMPMAILDEHLAKHGKGVLANETRSYNNTEAHAQLSRWLDLKATQFNVTYGFTNISGNYKQYLKKITKSPTQCRRR